ncbi:MAG TPA: stage III sporulation protein AA [Cerasibacillus sp.]|uniref:stage III sporulation protein AA n=1 Tax=Cerasibacillus sp. TaxID=2498711 RepID=UPI002F422B73
MEEILRLFPNTIRRQLEQRLTSRWDKLQEIRFRTQKPIELIFDNHHEWLTEPIPTHQDRAYVVNQLSEFSLYRLSDELREGFITIEGGHRVGIAGKVNTENGVVKAIQPISFFNIRIAKQIKGVSKSLIPYLYEKGYKNTLMIGAPQTGKTTYIRDLTRMMSSGWQKAPAQKVGVIDERSEIGASINGIPQHDLGKRTDVLDACPKAEGMMMLIRSMSPDILVVDEIGSDQDVTALLEAIHAGVTVICTAHGNSVTDIRNRPSFSRLFEQNVFERFVILNQKKIGHIKAVYDSTMRPLLEAGGDKHEMVWRHTNHHRHNTDWI